MQRDFTYYTHGCKSQSLCILAEGWQTKLDSYEVLPQAFFSISALSFEKKFCNVKGKDSN
jgi:hypothetical protein